METTENFSEKDLRLKQFTVGVQDGFVFLNLQDDSGTLQDWLGDFSNLRSEPMLSIQGRADRVQNCRIGVNSYR